MEAVTSQPEYSLVYLFTAPDVVQHSFLVQQSLSPLNLELRKSYMVENPFLRDKIGPYFSYSRDMIHTKEKCRKIHEQGNVLYNLHLDLPKNKEVSLMRYLYNEPLIYDNLIHKSLIGLKYGFYLELVSSFVEYACHHTAYKNKMLKWLIKFNVFNKFEYSHLPDSLANYYMDTIDSKFTDLEFIRECFKKLHFVKWLDFNLKPEKLENLLVQVLQVERKINLSCWSSIFKEYCIRYCKYIGTLLKIQNAPTFDYPFLFINSMVITQVAEGISYLYSIPDIDLYQKRTRRNALLIYLLWIYRKVCCRRRPNPSAASEAMRLVWESIPDGFFSYEEIVLALERFVPDEVESIYNLYFDALGEYDISARTRSLKHFCRTAIRRRLHENKEWLPDGIGKIGVPKKLQSYLNLEKNML